MINFASSETSESDEVIKKSFAFIIDFEIMNGLKNLIVDLINRFFDHRVSLHSRTKIAFEVVFEIVPKIIFFVAQTVLFTEKDINRT